MESFVLGEKIYLSHQYSDDIEPPAIAKQYYFGPTIDDKEKGRALQLRDQNDVQSNSAYQTDSPTDFDVFYDSLSQWLTQPIELGEAELQQLPHLKRSMQMQNYHAATRHLVTIMSDLTQQNNASKEEDFRL